MERGVVINAKDPIAVGLGNVQEFIGPSSGRNLATIICASVILNADPKPREGLKNRLVRYAAEEELKRDRWYRGTVATVDPRSEKITAVEEAARVADGFARSEAATQDERLMARTIARAIRILNEYP